jgi:hypothetical protein
VEELENKIVQTGKKKERKGTDDDTLMIIIRFDNNIGKFSFFLMD